MDRLYEDKDLVKEIKRRRLRNELERGGVIGLLAFECSWLLLLFIGIIKEHLSDYLTILNCMIVVLGLGGRHITESTNQYLKDCLL